MGETAHQRFSDSRLPRCAGGLPDQGVPRFGTSPQQSLANSEWRIKARRAAVTDRREGLQREETLNQVDMGWLGGCFHRTRKQNK